MRSGGRLRRLESELEAPARIDFGRAAPGAAVDRTAPFHNRGEIDLALTTFTLELLQNYALGG